MTFIHRHSQASGKEECSMSKKCCVPFLALLLLVFPAPLTPMKKIQESPIDNRGRSRRYGSFTWWWRYDCRSNFRRLVLLLFINLLILKFYMGELGKWLLLYPPGSLSGGWSGFEWKRGVEPPDMTHAQGCPVWPGMRTIRIISGWPEWGIARSGSPPYIPCAYYDS